MGQRLTIRIYQNKEQEKSIATLYYHWSAYTESALEELKTFYNNYRHYFKIQQIGQKLLQHHPTPFEDVKQYNELDNIVTSIYQAVIETGGGYASDEAENAINLYPALNTYYNPNHSVHRNNGLVAFTEEEQNGLYSWSEGNINLYLDEQEFQFNVYSSYDMDDLREYLDDLIGQWFKFNTENIDKITDEQIIDYCTNNLPKFDDAEYHKIDNIDELMTVFEEHSILYDPNEEMVIYKIY
jgi:hypothetical protein